ncbi:MAG: hypothetical protein VYE77_08955 [Planctomycetota bacterium]|nr:hypothetical protein [Planctomycetota bacterium]
MALRKEQVLLLASLGVAALVWKYGGSDEWRAPRVNASKQDYEASKLPGAPIVDEAASDPSLRPWFREPSETQPLPPTDLPWPPRKPLFLVALPLHPGPDISRADMLRISGERVAGVTRDVGEGTTGTIDDGGSQVSEPVQSREQKKRRWAQVYDQVYISGQSEPLFGIVTVPGVNKLDLQGMTDFSEVVVELLQFSLAKQELVGSMTFDASDRLQQVEKIVLAKTLRNEVGLRTREVPEEAAYHNKRLELIDWLMQKAQLEAWVYDVALKQVAILEQKGAGLQAQRAKARVLRAKGDLTGEFALYEGLEGSGPVGAFRHEGLGLLQARLGLHEAAEAELRKSIDMVSSDSRLFASLAQFLGDRGRPEEAAQMARRARAMIGSVSDGEEREEVVAIVVGAMLGVGDLEGARDAMLLFGGGTSAPKSYLRACLDYAAGDVAKALDGFRNAAAAGYGAAAELGLAACQLRSEDWRDAALGLQAVVEEAPLLRSQALNGLALLHLRIGQNDRAVSLVERAIEVNPLDAYSYYLLGRAQSGQGMWQPALDAQMQALELRDDFVPALAEVANLHMVIARQENEPAEKARNALAAMRYSDRAAELAAVPMSDLAELQGLAHFFAADLRGADEAFRRAIDLAPAGSPNMFAQAGLVEVDYARQRTEDARNQLDRLTELPPDNPMRKWAEATALRIDKHAQKEQLDDRFARDEIGNVWQTRGKPGPRVEGEQLIIRGRFDRTGEVIAERRGAVQKAGRFLAVSVVMQCGTGHEAGQGFTGLQIQTQRGGSGASNFVARIGLRDGKPHLMVQDGRAEAERRELEFTPDGRPVSLELRVQERSDGRQFRLLCLWNGVVVHNQDLKTLSANTNTELETQLRVSGRSGQRVDVRFDDYHLERRKDG